MSDSEIISNEDSSLPEKNNSNSSGQKNNEEVPTSASNTQVDRIQQIVIQENARRRRTVWVLTGLLAATIILALLVLTFGRTEQKIIEKKTAETIEIAASPIIERQVSEKVPSIMKNQLPSILDSELTPRLDEAVSNGIESRIQTEVTNQVEPRIIDLKKDFSILKDSPLFSKTNVNKEMFPSNFNLVEERKIKDVIAQFPRQVENYQRLSGQIDELVAISNAVKGDKWKEDEPEIRGWLTNLNNRLEETQTKLTDLSNKMDVVIAKLNNSTTVPCTTGASNKPGAYLTYSVKENNKSNIYDLGLRVELRGRKKEIIKNFIVYKNNTQIFGPQNIKMGELLRFEDDKYEYSLIPIFVNRRSLVDDFIGLAISRSEKCTPGK